MAVSISRRTLLVAVGLAVVVVVVAAVFAVTLLGGAHKSVEGYWEATSAGSQGFVIQIVKTGDTYSIQVPGFATGGDPVKLGAGTLKGDTLVMQKGGSQLEFSLTGDRDHLVMKAGGSSATASSATATLDFARATEAEATKAVEPTVQQRDKANDSAVREGIHAIQVGVTSWAADHNDKWPPAGIVSRAGLAKRYVGAWPANPFTGQPMSVGKDPGDYTYESTGDSYKLTGYGAGDTPVVTVP